MTYVIRIIPVLLLTLLALISSISAHVLFTVSRHSDTIFTNNDFDNAMDVANDRLRIDNGHCSDVPCTATIQRSGDVNTFGTAGDGLDTVDTQAELDTVFAVSERVKVVTSLSRCAGANNPSFIGCGICNGFGFVVENWVQGNVYVHEYGHNIEIHDCNVNNGHRDDCDWNIMHSISTGNNDAVNQAECTAFGGNIIALPDTGQTKCYRGVSPYDEIPCAGTGQDGEYTINPMSFTDNGNGTVTDNNTNLMWQKCSVGQNNDATCSGTAMNYNWYQASGTYNAAYNPGSTDVCGSLVLGGYSDWRLPAKKELISIVDYSIPIPGPTINTTYFPNTILSIYWSSTTGAGSPGDAWNADFSRGDVGISGKFSFNRYVRCVRGGQSAPSFADNGNGTVTDNRTGLMWEQGESGYMTWDSALSYCEGLSLGNNTDWRLPNIKELESITDDTRYNPAIDTNNYFPNAYATYYWSSTTSASSPSYAWVVYFSYGSVFSFYKNPFSYCVRCVRGGVINPNFMGDINKDGIIDISDVILVLRIALKIDPVQPCSDLNNDGVVDISDVILTLRMALKIDPLKQCI